METIEAPGTAAVHGRLWGARARDWADIQEGQHRPDYEAAFARLGLPAGASYCDVGCASGIAALIASQRGARVWELDAAEKLIEIARARVPSGKKRWLCIDRYFERGPLEYEWSGWGRDFTTAAIHATLEDWIGWILEAGFHLRALKEPRPTEQALRKRPDLEDAARVAYYLLFDLACPLTGQ